MKRFVAVLAVISGLAGGGVFAQTFSSRNAATEPTVVHAGPYPLDLASESGLAAPSLESTLLSLAPTLRPQALHAALSAWQSLTSRGEAVRPILTVIDYSLPSTAKRMWVFDLASRTLLFHELVAHGKNSGEDLASAFSNDEGSLMTSLGAYLTGGTYTGKNGYSLKLRGMDPGINDHAEGRTIVMHGAPYVSESFVQKAGRLGRSWGCPAVRPEIARTLIDRIKDQTLLYAWNPSLQLSEPAVAAVTTANLSH